MKLDLYQIDSFIDSELKGNPACVVPLNEWLSDEVLLNIAKENAVAETAFFIESENRFYLRWFTPEIEMDLCGHATLATAHCIKTILGYKNKKIIFETLSGDLVISCRNDYYSMDFPSRVPFSSELPEIILQSLNITPKEVYKARDFLLLYESEKQIKDIRIDKVIFDQINLGYGGVIVTSKGENSDFVSRYFTPQSSILEDPVTGSSHCTLTPFWSKRLNKKKLEAIQLSERGGFLKCLDKGKRVIVSGKAKTCSSKTLILQ